MKMKSYEVMTNVDILHQIQSFQIGIPYYVKFFVQDNHCQCNCKSISCRERTEKLMDIIIKYKKWKVATWIRYNKFQVVKFWLKNFEIDSIGEYDMSIEDLNKRREDINFPYPAFESIETAQWLFTHLYRDFHSWQGYLDCAVAKGLLDIVQFIEENVGIQCTGRAIFVAAVCGHLPVLKYLYSRGQTSDVDDTVYWVALNGHLDIVMFMMELTNDYIEDGSSPMYGAVEGGHLQIVKYLHTKGVKYCSGYGLDTMSCAAQHGHLHIVEYLHNKSDEVTSCFSMINAASGGYLDIVKYLHENRQEEGTVDAMDDAAENGHLNVVKYLHEHRDEGCTKRAMNRAAARGHLDVVQFLHAHRSEGCDTNAMDDAAKNGHLDVVKFLHENRSEGCTAKAMKWAAEYGHLDVVKYLFENRNEGVSESYFGNVIIDKYHVLHHTALRANLKKNGIMYTDDEVFEAVDKYNAEVIKYLKKSQ